MTRLPTPGGDDNTWGDILNAYLEVSHNSDGTLANNVVGTSQIQNNAITNTQLDTTTQTSLTKADNSLQTTQLGAASGVATLDGSSTLTASQLPGTVVSGASVLSLRQFGAQLAGADETAILNTALASFPTQGGKLLIPAGTLKTTSQVVIPPSVTVLLDAGLNWQIGHTDGLNAIVLSASSVLMGHGLGSASTQIEVLSTANIASVIANLNFGSTLQEWAQVSGIHIKADAGATITGYGIDFRQLFITSFIKDVTINCGSTIPVGMRLSGGTSQGFGPLVVDNIWILSSTGDGILITEANPSVGSCIAWLNNINIEHWGQAGTGNNHGLHIVGFGGLQGITIRNLQTEWNVAQASASSHVYIDGATGVDIDGFEMFTTNTTNKTGVTITNNSHNQRYRIHRLENVNLLNPAVTDSKTGFSWAGHSLDEYTSAFQVSTFGPREHYGATTTHGGGSSDRSYGQTGEIAPTGYTPANTLSPAAARTYCSRFVPSRDMTITKLVISVISVEGSSGNDPVDAGIYSVSGATLNKIATASDLNSGNGITGIFNGTGPKALAIPSTPLTAGTIYYILIATNTTLAGTAPSLVACSDQGGGQGFGTAIPLVTTGFFASAQPLGTSYSSQSSTNTVPTIYVRES